MIQIDDAGWGSFVGGVLIGAYRTETREFACNEILVTFILGEAFARKAYLEVSRDVARRVLEQLRVGKDEPIEICTGYIPRAEVILSRDTDDSVIAGCFNFIPFQADFLAYQPESLYNRIVMNPPFENLADVDHVRHAYELLADGGILVAIMSASPFQRNDYKAQEFRVWLKRMNGETEELPDGSFLESDRSTGVATRLVVIPK